MGTHSHGIYESVFQTVVPNKNTLDDNKNINLKQ